jgi:hypothetical protein
VLQCQRLEKREQLFVDFLHVHKKSPRRNAESDLQKKRNASVEFGGKERTLIPLKKVFLSEGRSEHACARCKNAGSLTELISVKFTKLRVLRTE